MTIEDKLYNPTFVNDSCLLVTKELPSFLRNKLHKTAHKIEEYNGIAIEMLVFEIKAPLKNVIVTSKNGAKALVKFIATKQEEIKVFCVGLKTKSFLESNLITVQEWANNALELANIIKNEYQESTFYFLCGDRRRNDLPEELAKNKVQCKEVVVYKTILKPKAFKANFDGILFFSPSGVTSFTTHNKIATNTVCFCIGNTTAAAVKRYSKNIKLAAEPTVESTVDAAVLYYKDQIGLNKN